MKAVVMHDGAVVQVTLSRRNVERLLHLSEVGRLPAQMRQGNMTLDPPEPTVIVAMEEDDVHYTDERYVGPRRSGAATSNIAEAVERLTLTAQHLESGDDGVPGGAAVLAASIRTILQLVDEANVCKGGNVDCKRDTDGDGDCPACATVPDKCCGGGDCANC